jgi:MinD superfamily P-loop ATPase
LKELSIPLGVIINRSDGKDKLIRDYCQRESVPVLMTIPQDRAIAVAYSEGKTILDIQPLYKERFLNLFEQIQGLIQ